MSSMFNKYVSAITVVTILLLLLLTTSRINLTVFVVLMIPLSIAMLIVGILEFKNTLKKEKS